MIEEYEDELGLDTPDDGFDDEVHVRKIRRGISVGTHVSSEEKLEVKERKEHQPEERDPEDDRVYIAEMASIIGRYEHTVRRWVREAEKVFGYAGFVPDDQGLLPQEHWPEREPEGRKRLYWRNDQVEQMKSFAQMKESRRGWHGASRS